MKGVKVFVMSCSLCVTLVPEGFALSYPCSLQSFVDTYAVRCA